MVEISRFMCAIRLTLLLSLLLLTTFTATLRPLEISLAWYTFANAPQPRSFPISYFLNNTFSADKAMFAAEDGATRDRKPKTRRFPASVRNNSETGKNKFRFFFLVKIRF
ncbi:hypothetical protein ABFS83_01G054800 [Erythranthe nasuta]